MHARHLWLGGILLVVLGASVAAAAQSLADVARKEAERRKGVAEAAKVYTNDDVEKVTTSLTTGTSAKPSAPADSAAVPPAVTAGDGKAQPGSSASRASSADAAKADEAAWRTRIGAARQELAKAEAFERALQSQINGLWAEFTARDNPVERSKIERDRGDAMGEQERLKVEIVSLKKQIADIEEEARRAGVPAGWLR